jgi:hypothetical protein
MSLSREIGLHLNDEKWLLDAFKSVLRNLGPEWQNSRSAKNWFRKHVLTPLYRSGVDATTYNHLRRLISRACADVKTEASGALARADANPEQETTNAY